MTRCVTRSGGGPLRPLGLFFAFLGVTALMGCSGLTRGSPAAGEGITPPDRFSHLVQRLLSSKPSASPLSVSVWTDKKAYYAGETISFFFRTDRDAYLTLIDVGTSGTVRILFPNALQRDNRVRAGEIYTVPSRESGFVIKVEGPPGLERVKAIATPYPLSFFDKMPSDGFLTVSRRDVRSARTLERGLLRLNNGRWAESDAEIIIVPGDRLLRPPGRFRTVKPKKPKKPIDITGTAGLSSGAPEVKEAKEAPSKK